MTNKIDNNNNSTKEHEKLSDIERISEIRKKVTALKFNNPSFNLPQDELFLTPKQNK